MNRIRTRTMVILMLALVLACVGSCRAYRELVPSGPNFFQYVIFVRHGKTIISPGGREFEVRFNDAGAMHSGRHHWTYVVGYSHVIGKYIVTQGDLDRDYAFSGEIPVHWNGETPVVSFVERKQNDN